MSIKLNKVIITGVTGFIGGALAKRLLYDGVKVYGIGRNAKKLEELKQYGDFIPVLADFNEYDKLHEIIADRGFDMFYHLAWNGTSTYTYNDYNVQIANIKTACDAANSAVFLQCGKCSSSSSYQQCDVNMESFSGIDPFNPVMYGIVKKCAVDMFKSIAYKHKMPCVNLIFPNTYGPNDKLNTAIVLFIKNLLANKSLNLISGNYQDDWMYIDDLIEGIIAASYSKKEYGQYYVGHRKITTFKEKLSKMKDVLNSQSALQFGAYHENYYVDYAKFDVDALYRDTGWEAKMSFQESIIKTTKWIKFIISLAE
jgi:nucleoside-diphosphate-sugar epimerase